MEDGVCDYLHCASPAVWDITSHTRMAVLEECVCEKHRNDMIPREALEVHMVKRIPHG